MISRASCSAPGFALAPDNVPVQIWPMGNRSMADIAVQKDEVSYVDCKFKSCSQPNNVTAY